MNNIVIEVSSVQSFIYGPLLGCFLAMKESGLADDAENFVTLAYAQPCWTSSKSLSPRERRRSPR
jgi:hypothetical protein